MKKIIKNILTLLILVFLFSCKNTQMIRKSSHTFSDIDSVINLRENPVFLFCKGSYYKLNNISVYKNELKAKTDSTGMPQTKYIRIESKKTFTEITGQPDSLGFICLTIKPVWQVQSVFEKKGKDGYVIYHKQGPYRRLKHSLLAGAGLAGVAGYCVYFVTNLKFGPYVK